MAVAELTARRALVTPDRIRAFLEPRSIAIVGASNSSSWAINLMNSLRLGGGVDKLCFVHPKYPELFGHRTVATLRDLAEPVDMAYIMVGPGRVIEILEDAAAAGIHNAVVLAAGYGEAGEEGQLRQFELQRAAEELDITIMGPNTIGFINGTLGIAPWAVASHYAPVAGPVSAVFESGSISRATYEFAQAHAVGVSTWASLGNSAVMNTLDVLDYLVGDESTKSIALFLETVRDPDRFIEVAHRALEAGKPIVAYKAGRSEEGMRSAMAHTGAMATNDAVVDAAFKQAGIVRVESLEELVSTVGLLGYTDRRPRGRRMGVVTSSGGGCNVIADLASNHDLPLPEWQQDTVDRLREMLPPFASTLNPLDTTGFGHARERPRHTKAEDDLMEIAAEDSGIDFMFTMMTPLPPVKPSDPVFIESRMEIIGQIAKASPVPIFFSSNTALDVHEYPRDLLQNNGIYLLPGVDLAMSSIGYMMRWIDQSESILGREGSLELPLSESASVPAGTWDEASGRDLLEAAGVPMVPARLVTTADDAARAVAEMGGPVAMKVCSRDIPHKSDVGGVVLGVTDADAARSAFGRIIRSSTTNVPGADIRGVLVSPMREPGLELLVGVTVDPTFGPVLTVALGGIWVETLKDSSIRVLPVVASDIVEMLNELKGSALLKGARGTAAVDLDALSESILAISRAALSLGGQLEALEVNPLRISNGVVESLDVLVSTIDATEADSDDH
ncbi:acetate--CoA ligase family protein [Subtercola endophyticus]|uniref:acetate--CoA ligase family protein n=1 Tax=Subtercola endophyticus TaxID=2895559 RepID=UPI001E4539DC|nr:acetate--CoA ligase family protein [Subtercola endophyticus]UFS58334.1 acetate--CoA ligase family protein [Subtercola endophyticus]